MSTRELIFYYAGGCTLFVLCLAVSYWSVNFFIRQFTQRSCQDFRARMMAEAERALKLFREGLCEQIVQQERRSDSLSKLYAFLIDLLRVGKELVSAQGRGDLAQMERMLKTVRSTGESFADLFHKESLHYTDEFRSAVENYLARQKAVQLRLEELWGVLQKDREGSPEGGEMKKEWLQFEEVIGHMMDTMRSEFRNRHPAGNVMLKWLSDNAASRDAAPPP